MKIRLLSYVILLVLFVSCFSIKPQVTKTGKNLWEDFLVAPGVMQYFIKPLTFVSNDRSIEIDFTFRNISDSVTFNYSIYSNSSYIEPNAIIISNELMQTSAISPNTIFSEHIQKKYKLRQTGKISLSEFKILTKNNIWTISVANDIMNDQYFATQKTNKKIEIINSNLMLQLNQ